MTSLLSLYRNAVTSNSWFDSLPAAIREDILSRARQRELAAGERVYSRGKGADGFYKVVAGSVCISGVSREGHVTVLDFYGPGAWFAEVSALDGGSHVHDASAYEPTSLLQITLTDLEELLVLHPTLSRSLLRLEAQRLRLLLAALESYSAQSMEQRLANRLLMLALAFGETTKRGAEIKLHLPQETLGQLIGTTRQRVNQILKEWERDGIVQQPEYGRILLRDQHSLGKLAEM